MLKQVLSLKKELQRRGTVQYNLRIKKHTRDTYISSYEFITQHNILVFMLSYSKVDAMNLKKVVDLLEKVVNSCQSVAIQFVLESESTVYMSMNETLSEPHVAEAFQGIDKIDNMTADVFNGVDLIQNIRSFTLETANSMREKNSEFKFKVLQEFEQELKFYKLHNLYKVIEKEDWRELGRQFWLADLMTGFNLGRDYVETGARISLKESEIPKLTTIVTGALLKLISDGYSGKISFYYDDNCEMLRLSTDLKGEKPQVSLTNKLNELDLKSSGMDTLVNRKTTSDCMEVANALIKELLKALANTYQR